MDGVPVLVADTRVVDEQIAKAQAAGRGAWYSDEQAIQFTGPYRHHQRKRIAFVEGAIERLAPRESSERLVLDVGCGDGEHHAWLSRHAAALHASDYNLVRLRRAAARGIARVFLADLTHYPALDESYDVIFCNHVLEHVPDDLQALRELRRLLRPDGLLVLGVPNEGAAFWRLAYRLQPDSRQSTDHVHFYTARSVEGRCRAAGLEILETHPIGWGLPHWSLDARIRGVKVVDDLFEGIGRRLLRGQATSLYVLLGRGVA